MHYQVLPGLSIGPITDFFSTENSGVLDGKDIIVLTSPSVEKIDLVEETIDILKTSTPSTPVYHISPEVPIVELENIVDSHETAPEHIIAIGGGSVIDAAKVLSIAWNDVSIRDLFYNRVDTPSQKVAVTAVPTTAGTGAELSHGAIVYDKSNSKKGGIRGAILQPNAVAIDARIHQHAPPKLIAETGFDCLTHAIETFCSKASNGIARYQSVKAIETVFLHLRKAVDGKIGALEKMAIAASFMGVNLAHSRTCLPHRIQYVIGPFTNTSHAQGLIMLYKGWIPKISQEDIFEDLARDLQQSSGQLVKEIKQLKADLSIDYKLTDHGVESQDVETLVSQVGGSVELDPCYRNSKTLEQIIVNSL